MNIEVPAECENLFIDVGLSIDAPHSALWLLKDPKAFVIGIEPSPENLSILKKGRTANVAFAYLNLDDNSIIKNNERVGTIDERFYFVESAIDNVDKKVYASFYMTDDRNTGCSSLLKPTSKLGLDVKQIYQTPVISLKSILDNISFSKFKYITLLKTDAQGKDFDVVKSCREYLKKVLLVKMEVRTDGCYEKEQNVEDIKNFMKEEGFALVFDSYNDHIYLNDKLHKEVENLNVESLFPVNI